MTTATPQGAIGAPGIPDDNWVGLQVVVAYLGCDRPLLERQVEQLGIPPDRTASIRRGDLARLVGPVAARTITHFIDTFGPEAVGVDGAASLLKVDSRHVLGLVQRRGVLVGRSSGESVMGRSGVVSLARILERERAFPILEDDFLPVPEEIPQPRRARHLAFLRSVRSRPPVGDSTEPERYRGIGIRCREGAGGRSVPGRVQWVGFDLYRLLGLERPGMRLEAYCQMMDRAFAEETGMGPGDAMEASRATRIRAA
jgi:hypothetical protein